MPSLDIAPHPEGCTGPFTMPAPGVTSASGAMPTDGSLRRLEIGVQAVQLSPYHTGPADASVPAPGPDRRFSGMRLSRSPFGSGLAIGPKNLPSSSSRLRRGYDKAPRGAIKVVHRHPAIGFVEAELWSVLLGASPIAHEHLLDLLGHDDCDYSGLRRFVDVFAHVVDLAVIPAGSIGSVQMKDWDAIDLGEAADRVAEAITNLLEQRRRGDAVAKVFGQEGDHLAAHLQVGDVPVEVDPIQAFEIHDDMPVQDIVDIDHFGHPTTSSEPNYRSYSRDLGGLRRARRRTSLVGVSGF